MMKKKAYIKIIHRNIIDGLQIILAVMQNEEEFIPYKNSIQFILRYPHNTHIISPELKQHIITLASLKSLLITLDLRSSELGFLNNLKVFLNDINRICSDSFIPTEQDILYARTVTTAIAEAEWMHENLYFKMTDVGGQRNHRRKWIHCFDSVTAIIYCVALNEYDMVMREDPLTNRMHETLQVFESLVNSTWFSNTDFIIFFNKFDLFTEKNNKSRSKCLLSCIFWW